MNLLLLSYTKFVWHSKLFKINRLNDKMMEIETHTHTQMHNIQHNIFEFFSLRKYQFMKTFPSIIIIIFTPILSLKSIASQKLLLLLLLLLYFYCFYFLSCGYTRIIWFMNEYLIINNSQLFCLHYTVSKTFTTIWESIRLSYLVPIFMLFKI